MMVSVEGLTNINYGSIGSLWTVILVCDRRWDIDRYFVVCITIQKWIQQDAVDR